MATVTEVRAYDVRFPTSLNRDGSDAMNQDANYSAAYWHDKTNINDPKTTPLLYQ